ncbi:hypothetical protein [Bordetella bronchiseptica]|uniref:hypothetical protein n=1 Tax=Bordetella bronchiseptica TaxID=518 RepID=UPI001178300E|nr:hypothetical protein [Bordetella bronchiseptica]KAB1444161.1 hypothetical protein F7D00_21100 [Bordetella bronchiseptica]KAB1569267.1 hypothetical protein F7890_21100 [Bordetella bronchiseptica]
MAIFDRIPAEVIAREFTHYGLFLGCVPVYVGDPEGECRVAVRNWWPEWLLDFANASLGLFVSLGFAHGDSIMIKITGPIHQQVGGDHA